MGRETEYSKGVCRVLVWNQTALFWNVVAQEAIQEVLFADKNVSDVPFWIGMAINDTNNRSNVENFKFNEFFFL
jgi:hypothetical protein